MKRTLVVGFGNLLLGDDGFGVEVVRRLGKEPLPPEVRALEVGIGGFDLVLGLMEGYENLIVVDALRRGGPPGTVTVFHPSEEDLEQAAGGRVDPHVTEPTRAMSLARRLGLLPRNVTVVGCEVAECELGLQLTGPVAGAVPAALSRIREMIGGRGRAE